MTQWLVMYWLQVEMSGHCILISTRSWLSKTHAYYLAKYLLSWRKLQDHCSCPSSWTAKQLHWLCKPAIKQKRRLPQERLEPSWDSCPPGNCCAQCHDKEQYWYCSKRCSQKYLPTVDVINLFKISSNHQASQNHHKLISWSQFQTRCQPFLLWQASFFDLSITLVSGSQESERILSQVTRRSNCYKPISNKL